MLLKTSLVLRSRVAAAAAAPSAFPPLLQRLWPSVPTTNSASVPSSPFAPSRPKRHGSSRAAFSSRPPSSSLASLVKELRSATGAPMVQCKKALTDPEVNMDLDRAADWLRSHGVAKASSKVSGRETTEGMVGLTISENGDRASLVKVGAETDFASRSAAFSSLVEDVAAAALKLEGEDATGRLDVEGELMRSPAGGGDEGGTTVKDALDEAILSIRENVRVVSATSLRAANDSSSGRRGGDVLVGYIHGRAPGSKCAGTAAAVVEIGTKDDVDVTKEEMEVIGKRLAMHVVAAKPTYLNPNEVPEEIVQKERDLLIEQMADSGKPANILEKIVNGRLRKFYEGVCLTEQSHMIEEGNPKVSKLLKEKGLQVLRFEALSMK